MPTDPKEEACEVCGAHAVVSECGRYRYRLGRRWFTGGTAVLFVMLNPSTADAERDDPTIRRCIGFARAWGHGAIEVVNLFALRATNPRALLMAGHADANGPDNDRHILDAVDRAGAVVCAWGAHPFAGVRGNQVADLVRRAGHKTMCLRKTKAGYPAHPLYLPANLQPMEFH